MASKSYSYSVKKPVYKKSTEQLTTKSELEKKENSKPAEYSSKYTSQLDSVLKSILNRGDFKYSLNADPLYKQYREQYIRNGERAMADTVGKVSALTGGYGSSYAVTAGNESYSNELSKLNSAALELYDRAYSVYKDKGESLYDSLDALRSMDSDDYKKYRDTVSDYYEDRDYLYKKLADMSDLEYEMFLDELDSWESDRDFSYKQYTDEIEKQQYEQNMAFKKAEAERNQANADRNYRLALQKLYSSGSSSSSSSSSKKSSSSSSDTETDTYSPSKWYPRTYAEFVKTTGKSIIMNEKEFAASEAAQETYKSYSDYLKQMYKKYG